MTATWKLTNSAIPSTSSWLLLAKAQLPVLTGTVHKYANWPVKTKIKIKTGRKTKAIWWITIFETVVVCCCRLLQHIFQRAAAVKRTVHSLYSSCHQSQRAHTSLCETSLSALMERWTTILCFLVLIAVVFFSRLWVSFHLWCSCLQFLFSDFLCYIKTLYFICCCLNVLNFLWLYWWLTEVGNI